MVFMPLTLHAAWLRSDVPYPDGRLFFWAEFPENSIANGGSPALGGGDVGAAQRAGNGRQRLSKVPSHPFQASVGQVRALMNELIPSLQADAVQLASASLWLPTEKGAPLARRSVLQHNGGNAAAPAHLDAVSLAPWQVAGVELPPLAAFSFLSHLQAQSPHQKTGAAGWRHLRLGNDLLFWSNAAKVALEMLVGQHYLPALRSDASGRFFAVWQPSLIDKRVLQRVEQLAEVMPPVSRAYNLEDAAHASSAQALLDDFLATMVDVAVRAWGQGALLPGDSLLPVRHWMERLGGGERQLALPPQAMYQLYQEWRTWMEQLHVPSDANFRICFSLIAPDFELEEELPSGPRPATDKPWVLKYSLQARDNPALFVSAAEVWQTSDHALRRGSRRLDQPQERLLAGLGIASRLFAPIERSLRSPYPEQAQLTLDEAYRFLREIGPLLESSGFGVILPDWWDAEQRTRLGLRLRLYSEETASFDRLAHGAIDHPIRHSWELTLGSERLSAHEFEQLAAMHTPLVRMRNRWIEFDPVQVEAAKRFLGERRADAGMSFLQSLRMAQSYIGRDLVQARKEGAAAELAGLQVELASAEETPAQLPLEAVDVEGWLRNVLEQLRSQQPLGYVPAPSAFVGTLRPYQQRGVGWLAYLRQLGIGACLADDMGLGKTIQAIALLLHVREQAQANGAPQPGPALLICPTSVVANWRHEIERFGPTLRVLVHHGANRMSGDEFLSALSLYDLIITSYGTARRDIELLQEQHWSDLILDEAQNIKNPHAKQTQAIGRLCARNRMALTGTPVENQLAELWSIMDFLNPGYLGGFERFHKQFIVPIERYNDESRATELRRLVQPFLLRRLKSDPTIISDLPEKNEMVVYCTLTKEQADLYEEMVRSALAALEESSGIQRRGLVLGLLTKLKQITNHPAHFLKEQAPLAQRSGKLDRLTEMLDEALSVGDRALVFTQFVEMGHLLQEHLRSQLGADVLFLHGGTPVKQRDQMVQAFQEADGPAVFVLSLRAGGSGLNLTRANHVFHFDRWWNPAVEDQATDRAFRIGQTRNVQVHKFVVAGTMEERIHEMIQSKQALAEAIVGTGEDWLTELDNDQLRDVLMLRYEV